MAITTPREAATEPMPNLAGVLHEGILITDLPRSLAFYTDVLGLRELPRPNFPVPGAWLTDPAGRVQLHLSVTAGPLTQSVSDARNIGRHTAFAVGSLDALRARLRALDVTWFEQTGGDQVFVKDPDGNTLEFQEVTGA